MTLKITKKDELGPLISPKGNRILPIHNWNTFKNGYSKGLIVNLISDFNLSEGAWVLDPFCGGGTTLLTCKELGINAVGFDILPFAVFLATVKTQDYEEKELSSALEFLEEKTEIDCNITLPDIPLIEKAFQMEVIEKLLSLKQKIDEVREPKVKNFLKLAFLSILEPASNTSKAGGFLRIIKRDVDLDSIQGLFNQRVKSMVHDVISYSESNIKKNGRVLATISDARKLPTKQMYDAVITSPPYPNRHDYTRIYALEMIFGFISSHDELKKIRYETLRSHVEARQKYEDGDYKQPRILSDLIKHIKRNGTNNSQVVDMIKGYFEDMNLCLSEICRCLKSDGKVAMVVSNVRFSGVNIPVDEILAELGSELGLHFNEIWVARYRGNSSQQMRDYSRSPSRESVIVWEKNGH